PKGRPSDILSAIGTVGIIGKPRQPLCLVFTKVGGFRVCARAVPGGFSGSGGWLMGEASQTVGNFVDIS
ncbi:MAG: hypothetical protein ABFD16_30300, partial [Thermoguttaceae bacterium]